MRVAMVATGVNHANKKKDCSQDECMQNLPKQIQTINFIIDLVSKLKSQIPVHKVCNINAEKKMGIATCTKWVQFASNHLNNETFK